MKYPYVLVTCEGPAFLTQEGFEEFMAVYKEQGYKEILDDVYDYEELDADQAVILTVSAIKVNPARGSWTI